MADKENRSEILEYCAKFIQPNLASLTSCVQKIIKRENIEDIHDLRVASRRIRTCLGIFFSFLPKKKAVSWQKEIRSITKFFGMARDLDVQIDLLDQVSRMIPDNSLLPGVKRIRLRLCQKRERKQETLLSFCHSIQDSATIIEMQSWVESILANSDIKTEYSQDLYQQSYENIQTRLDNFLFFEVFLFDSTRIEELHQMRIAAKSLRYSIEVFSDLYKGKLDIYLDITRKTQQYLGSIHDCDVWIAFLPEFNENESARINAFYGYSRPFYRIKPGIAYLLQNRIEERNRMYRAFLEEWKAWKFNETWLNLRKVIFLASLDDQKQPTTEVLTDSPEEAE